MARSIARFISLLCGALISRPAARLSVTGPRKVLAGRGRVEAAGPAADRRQTLSHSTCGRNLPCCGDDEFDFVAIQLAGSSPSTWPTRPQAKLRNGGKQEAGLLDRGAAAGKGRWRAPQLAPNESMARQGFGVISRKERQTPWHAAASQIFRFETARRPRETCRRRRACRGVVRASVRPAASV